MNERTKEYPSVTSRQTMNEYEMAAYIGLSVATLRKWRFKGQGLPYSKVGKRVIYLKDDADSYLYSKRVEPRQ